MELGLLKRVSYYKTEIQERYAGKSFRIANNYGLTTIGKRSRKMKEIHVTLFGSRRWRALGQFHPLLTFIRGTKGRRRAGATSSERSLRRSSFRRLVPFFIRRGFPFGERIQDIVRFIRARWRRRAEISRSFLPFYTSSTSPARREVNSHGSASA